MYKPTESTWLDILLKDGVPAYHGMMTVYPNNSMWVHIISTYTVPMQLHPKYFFYTYLPTRTIKGHRREVVLYPIKYQ